MKIQVIDRLELDDIKKHSKNLYKLNSVKNALGDYWQIPLMVAKGSKGPVVGITAALHGNELNGVSIIHKLWEKIAANDLKGTLILAPVLNIPGFMNGTREFNDGTDLNRIMPGNPDGDTSEVYAHVIMENIVEHLDYLIDLHTASFGRINSLYVRADMTKEKEARMAELQEPKIIVNKIGEEGTLRGEAAKRGIHAITVEVGDPHLFQKNVIRSSIFGLNNVLVELGMVDEDHDDIHHHAIVCKNSHWLYARNGGILRVLPGLGDKVKKGDKIAIITNIFGEIIEEFKSPEDAVVVAKSTNPVCEVGSRVVHLGSIWKDYAEAHVELDH